MIPSLPNSSIASFLLALLVAVLLTPNVRRFAEAHGLLDEPNDSRRVHRRAVPRIGGLAVVAAFYMTVVGVLIYERDLGQYFLSKDSCAFSFLLGGLAIAALGLYDDLRGANAWQKFAVQFGIAALLYPCGYAIKEVALPGVTLQLGILSFPITLLWIVGIINALNLVDGLDGLAGGVALCAVVTNLVASAMQPHHIMTLSMAALAGALLGFLFYNFNPASIFLGDSGSLFLGYILATSSIRTHQKSSAVVSLAVPFVALALPIVDTLLAMGRRALAGRPMFSGDKEHIHHRLLKVGLSHRQAVLVLYATCIALSAVALALIFVADAVTAWLLMALSLAGFFALRQLGFFTDHGRILRLRKRNHRLHATLHDIARNLSGAESLPDVLESARQFGDAVSAQTISLELEGETFRLPRCDLGTQSSNKLYASYAVQQPAPLHAAFSLPGELGRVDLEWADGREEIDRDHEIAAETFCRKIGDALRRVSPSLEGSFARPFADATLIRSLGPAEWGKDRRDRRAS